MSLFEQLPDIQYDLSDKSRQEIRQDLFRIYKDESLLDLSQAPQTTDPYISISHTTGRSGWVSHPRAIGFDIEKSDREIKKSVILRVSKAEELQSAPSPIALWVAKEAAFKSLWRSHQPQVISQIEVSGWSRINSNLFGFKYCNINDLAAASFGWVEIGDRFTLGIASAAP